MKGVRGYFYWIPATCHFNTGSSEYRITEDLKTADRFYEGAEALDAAGKVASNLGLNDGQVVAVRCTEEISRYVGPDARITNAGLGEHLPGSITYAEGW